MLHKEFTRTKSKSVEVRAALFAPLTLWSDIRGPMHFVQFYESDTFLVHSIANYVSNGLKAGETCIVAATENHHKMLESFLSQDGSLDGFSKSGRFITVYSNEGLSAIMSGDMPDEQLFRDAMEPVLIKATKRGGGIRVFCESVAVLTQQGNSNASIELESMWNRLRTYYDFTLFCAYPTAGFADVPENNRLSICGEHAIVIPDESYTTLRTGRARLKKIASLQHRIKELEAELVKSQA